MTAEAVTTVASNRRARRTYDIRDTVECGLVLQGSEVKSLRESKVQLAETFGRIRDGEAWLYGLHISPYSHAGATTGHDPDRPKKLLLHRSELARLDARIEREKLELIPLALYFKDGRAKVELGLGKVRRQVDKRDVIARRDADREAERELANRSRR